MYLFHFVLNSWLRAPFKMLKPQIPNINAKMFMAAKNWYNLSDFCRNKKAMKFVSKLRNLKPVYIFFHEFGVIEYVHNNNQNKLKHWRLINQSLNDTKSNPISQPKRSDCDWFSQVVIAQQCAWCSLLGEGEMTEADAEETTRRVAQRKWGVYLDDVVQDAFFTSLNQQDQIDKVHQHKRYIPACFFFLEKAR